LDGLIQSLVTDLDAANSITVTCPHALTNQITAA
jgi:hypothetical protein